MRWVHRGWSAAGLAALAVAGRVQAQAPLVGPAVQAEVGASAVFSDANSILANIGANVPAGLYVRLAAGAGVGWEYGSPPGHVARVQLAARFLTDPFHEARWAPYLGGGLAGVWRSGDHGRPALMAFVGTDLPWSGAWTPALEAGVGGGMQVRLIVRRTRTRGR